ncbi:hypothetical protein A2U01_0014762, partial [Trifolium medium]|nr:hypothetical protein [Trifolium medium]
EPLSCGTMLQFLRELRLRFRRYLFCPDLVGNDPRISIPYQAKGHGDDSDLSSLGGARCMSPCLWHLSHFLTCSFASACMVGQ